MLGCPFPVLDAGKLDAILSNPKLTGAVVAAAVTDLEGNPIYEHDARRHVIPASNMKLFSGAFALYERGADWQPSTRIWMEPTRLIVDSPGDPLLSYSDLIRTRKKLGNASGLPVYVREAYRPLWSGDWEYGDLPNKFAAPVCAFTVDRGSFELWAKNKKPIFKPAAFGTRIVMADLPSDRKIEYDPVVRSVRAWASAFAHDGLIDTLSLPEPDRAAASILGGEFHLTEDIPNRDADLTLNGHSILDVLRACLPPSDNQLAEQLLFLGATREGPIGTDPYATAQKRIEAFLTHVVGIPSDEIRIDDGSGLSRHNFVTAHAIASLLAWANRQPTAEGWESALAHSGTGTLSHRLNDLRFSGKTGSLDGVAALSGYVETANHEKRIVSIVINEFGCSESAARGVIDEFVRAAAADK